MRARVGDRTVPVHYRRPRHDLLGYADVGPGRRQIVVAPDLPPRARASVLLHECLHTLNPRWSERQVLQVEAAVVGLLTANPKLFRPLLSRCRSKT